MNFSFTQEQKMLQDSIRKYLSKNYSFERRHASIEAELGYSNDVWTDLTKMGLLATPFSEELGGFGGSIVESVVICHELGKRLVIEPYTASVVFAARAVALGTNKSLHETLLPGVMAGETLLAFAHEERNTRDKPTFVRSTLTRSGRQFVLNGEKRCVIGALSAHRWVVTARSSGLPGEEDGISLFIVDPDSDGIELESYTTIDGYSAANICFKDVYIADDAFITELGQAYEVLRETINFGVVALCSEAIGAMGELLSLTTEYAQTRKQFGLPIAKFQVIQHRLADMFMAYQKCYSSLLGTTAKLEAGLATQKDISVLKAQTGKLGRTVGEHAVQTHGGIGTTDELLVGHHLKKILAVDAMYGNSDYHFRNVGAQN